MMNGGSMTKIVKFFVCLLLIQFCIVGNVFAVEDGMQFDIGAGGMSKIKIVFEPVADELVTKVFTNVKNNLETTYIFSTSDGVTNFFDTIDDKELIPNSILNEIVTDKYNKTGTDAVVSGYVKQISEDKIELRIRLWDTLDQRELFAKFYVINSQNWKRVADIISDTIYEFLTAEITGHFDSRILFIAETGGAKNRKKRVAVMDFDGSNLVYLTDGNNLVLTPIFSKYNKDEIIYLEYIKKIPHLFLINFKNETRQSIGKDNEMTFAANFNPAGKNEMLYSIARRGTTDIYKLDFDTKKLQKLTNDGAISTVPSYSPDGSKVIFTSDKNGKRSLYVMDSNGKNVRQISKGGGEYDKPSWSPDGRLISFVKMEKGRFYVGLMTPDGDSERLPISSYLVEGIKWSPNGRYLIYSKQKGAFGKDSIPNIYTYDILTGAEYRLPTPENQGATDPDWIKK
jgi:TolB protein